MKDIKGYEGLYAITEDGQVWSYRRKIFRKLSKSKDGYVRVSLNKDGKVFTIEIHKLVAQAYIPNPEGKPQVNHKDEDKTNNCVDNLEWVSVKENANHGTRNERVRKARIGKTIKRRKVYCVELDKQFNSQAEAVRETGISQTCLSCALNGKRLTAGGYHWRYVEC